MDEIVLTLPNGPEWHGVAHFVLSGLAARLDLTLEALEDWQLALCELLARQPGDGTVRIVFRISPESLETRFGPVSSQVVEELEREEEEGVGLRRVLSTITDDVHLESKNGDSWVVLRRAIVRPGSRR
jgi:anti-sigma regulatory factor (Ser/Thr protein kinase)